MKTKHFILPLLLMMTFLSWSQDEINKLDSLNITESFLSGYQYYSGGKGIHKRDFENIIVNDSEAFKYYKKGKNRNAFATFFGIVGGFGVGWMVGGILGGGEPNWVMGGVGAGSLIISIPLSISASKNFTKSVTIFNRNLSNQSSLSQQSDLSFTINRQKIGFILTF